jgi:hypothetical protein
MAQPVTTPSNPVITLLFRHKDGGGVLHAAIGAPQHVQQKAKDGGKDLSYWTASLRVEFNGHVETHTVGGADSLQPLLLAVEYVRRKIPAGEETKWVSLEGEESWCVLPKTLPIAWGHELYKKISGLVDDAEREFMANLERRRKGKGEP